MRFHSTPESAEKGEITILAIIECIVSVIVYLAICIYFKSFKYLAWPIAVAPLMLFRTEESTQWGLARYSQALLYVGGRSKTHDTGGLEALEGFRRISWYQIISGTIGLILTIVGGVAVGSCIRIAAPFLFFLRSPLQAFKEMPSNWLRQSLCVDVCHPPEVVPRETLSSDVHIKWGAFLEQLTSDKKTKYEFGFFGWLMIFGPALVVGYVPPMVYRFSFKATAIAYTPFIWAAHWTLVKTLSLKGRLQRITKGELEKVRRHASWPILLALMGKISLIYGWIDLAFITKRFPSQKIMEYFVVPGHWPWWQLTLVADATLTFFLFFFADAALARLEGQSIWSGEKVLKAISAVSFIRATLAICTVSHFFYLALITVVPQSIKHLLA